MKVHSAQLCVPIELTWPFVVPKNNSKWFPLAVFIVNSLILLEIKYQLASHLELASPPLGSQQVGLARPFAYTMQVDLHPDCSIFQSGLRFFDFLWVDLARSTWLCMSSGAAGLFHYQSNF